MDKEEGVVTDGLHDKSIETEKVFSSRVGRVTNPGWGPDDQARWLRHRMKVRGDERVIRLQRAKQILDQLELLNIPGHELEILKGLIDSYVSCNRPHQQANILRIVGEAFDIWGSRQVIQDNTEAKDAFLSRLEKVSHVDTIPPAKPPAKDLNTLSTSTSINTIDSINSKTDLDKRNGA